MIILAKKTRAGESVDEVAEPDVSQDLPNLSCVSFNA